MKVYKVTANILFDKQHFPINFSCEPFGNGDALEWHESLDLILSKFNNISVLEDCKGEVVECNIFMAKMPKKAYNQYRREHDLEGYSEIAESYINYDWIEIASKKLKH